MIVFFNYSEGCRQTNCGVLLKIDCPTLPKWNSRHMTSYAEEQSTICFEVTFHQQNFVEFGTRPTRWTVALFRAHTQRSIIRHLWRSSKRLLRHRHRIAQTLLYTTRLEPFLSDCQCVKCAGSNENKCFLRPGVHVIWNVCWCKICPRMPLSHRMSHDDPEVSVRTRHQ